MAVYHHFIFTHILKSFVWDVIPTPIHVQECTQITLAPRAFDLKRVVSESGHISIFQKIIIGGRTYWKMRQQQLFARIYTQKRWQLFARIYAQKRWRLAIPKYIPPPYSLTYR